jgi:hypothetical protein
MAKTVAKDYAVRAAAAAARRAQRTKLTRATPPPAFSSFSFAAATAPLLPPAARPQALTASYAKNHTVANLATIFKTTEKGVKARATAAPAFR